MKNLFFLITLVFCQPIFCSEVQEKENFEKEDVFILFQKDMFKGIKSKFPLMSVNNTVYVWPILTIDLELMKVKKDIIKAQKGVLDSGDIIIVLSGPIKALQFNLPNFVKISYNIKSRHAYLVKLHKSESGIYTLSLDELPVDRYMKLKRTKI